jgi:tetratricopeptide (TPR) repeat protein
MKPDNVKIMADGTVKVLDFGLAAQIRTSLAHVSKEEIARAGTNLYKSPEQWQARSRQGAAADQYSLAVTAYELLAGHVPFESDDMALLKAAVLKDDPEPIDGLPKYVNVVLKKGLAKEASNRYPTCMDFVRALGGEKVKPKGVATGRKKRDKLLWLGGAAVAALIVLAGILFALAGKGDDNPPAVGTATTPPEMAVEPPQEKPVGEAPSNDDTGGKTNPKQAEKAEPVDDEYYILANRLERFLKDDYDKNWDRRQTVGKHMDDFMTHYDGGYGAMKAGDHSRAYGNFKKAEVERKWLVDNIPLRKQALDAWQAAEDRKKKAESAHAGEYAHNGYENANKRLDTAAKLFEEGKFDDARKGFVHAGEDFEKTAASANEKHVGLLIGSIEDSIRNERIVQAEKYLAELEPLSRERHAEMKGKIERAKSDLAVKEHLKKAKDAADNGRWQEALDEANAVLKINPNHFEAKELKRRAEDNLHPVVSFEAKADGRVEKDM